MTEETITTPPAPCVAITPTIKKSPPKPKPTQPPSADNSVLAVNCCKILMTGERSRFVCKHPGCEREYASRDAVRKHCRLRHLAWLRSLKRTAVHDIEVLSKEAEAALPPPPRREPKRAAAPPPPPTAPLMPQMPYSPGMTPVSPLMTPSLVPIDGSMLASKMPSLHWELNKTPAQMPSAGDIFLIKDLPPLDAPGSAPDWSVRDINWGTLTGLVCRDLLDDSSNFMASPRLAPLAMTKSMSGLSAGFFGIPQASLGLNAKESQEAMGQLAHSQLNAVRMIIGA